MISSKVLKLYSSLTKLNKAFLNKKCRIIDSKVYTSNFLFYHYFYWSSEFYDSIYRNILIDFFDKAEKNYPGSSYFVSEKLCKLIHGKSLNTINVKTDRNFDSIMNYLRSTTDLESFNVFKNILSFSGSDATITCEKTKNKNIEVEKICMPIFDFQIENSFQKIYFNNIAKTTKNFIVSVIDGFIERESELYSLIDYSKRVNLPVILVCRGISEYAKQNLKQIILKNNVHFYPYIENYNNEDPFKMKDFCSLIETEPISGEFSDSINKDAVEKSRIVKCKVSKNKISLFEKNKMLIDEINLQIKENKGNYDLVKYLQKRKLRCSPNNTLVKIPESKLTLLNEIKNLIICYNYCAVMGVYTNKEGKLQSVQCKNISNIYSKNLYNKLKNISYKIKIGE